MTSTQEADSFFTEPQGNKGEAPKDGYGRYKLPDPVTGQPGSYTRATTVAGTLEDKYHLSLWRQRMVAHGLAIRPDLYALAAATPLEDKEALNKIADDACDAAGTSTGANFGTALHGFTATLDSGGDLSKIPEQFRDDIRAYHSLLANEGIVAHPGYIERTCLNEDFGVAGTFDRIYVLPDGSMVIGDLKTQKTMDFGAGSQGIQMAIYSRARVIRDFEPHTYEPMPPVRQDLALIVHLPVGKAKATLHWVDLRLGYYGAALAMQVREYRRLKTIVTPYSGHIPPAQPGAIAQPIFGDVTKKTVVTDESGVDWVAPVGATAADIEQAVGPIAAMPAKQSATIDAIMATPEAQAAIASAEQSQLEREIEELAAKSKQFLQAELRKLDPQANVAKYRKTLAAEIIKLRTEKFGGPNGTPKAEPEVGGAGVPFEPPTPPDPVPVNGRAAVLEGLPDRAAEMPTTSSQVTMPPANPFDTPEPNPFENPAPPELDPVAQLTARMRAADSKEELAAIWRDAAAAGLATAELQNVGGKRVMELKAAGKA